jgi:hypothetical protein
MNISAVKFSKKSSPKSSATSGDIRVTDNICVMDGCIPTSLAEWPDSTKKWNYSRNGEPNNNGSIEDCANISRSDGTWNDLPCTTTQYGVIEFD